MPKYNSEEQNLLNNKFIQAVIDNQQELAKKYLSEGADINAKDMNESTALHYSVINNEDRFLRFLIDNKADINIKNEFGYTPLFEAMRADLLDMGKTLIANGANVNAKGMNNETPLHVAVRNGFKEGVDLLLENKADINALNNNNETPVFIASMGKDRKRAAFKEINSRLLQEKNKESTQESSINLDLVEAVKEGDLAALRNLVSKGEVDINAKDSSGNNLLHIAAQNEASSKMIRYLVDQGVEVNAKNNNNKAAIDLLKDESSVSYKYLYNLVKELPQQQSIYANKDNIQESGINTNLVEAIKEGDLVALRDLFSKGEVDINAKDSSGNNLLHLAAQNEASSKMMRYLVDQGVEVNAKNNNNKAAIDLLKDESSVSYKYLQNTIKVKNLVSNMSSVTLVSATGVTKTVTPNVNNSKTTGRAF